MPAGALGEAGPLFTTPVRLFCDYPLAGEGMGSELWRTEPAPSSAFIVQGGEPGPADRLFDGEQIHFVD
jgi:hypothetical protein